MHANSAAAPAPRDAMRPHLQLEALHYLLSSCQPLCCLLLPLLLPSLLRLLPCYLGGF
jgi:hypothetical protein